ncbi:HTH-type transcriptional regulator RutR [Afifella sp. H1R]|uniref:HTH-type transcriptional regulator RutR n=1 Tax=Afifella sp. H1R TaxID=2908841 RepID=UPI001F434B48|nr:HTH-type transcriptional regulator RutR [Afifella sp. H1R]MCF1504373.1 HTH-type transcriptional regulator RutR [Afifella sp. H1R]
MLDDAISKRKRTRIQTVNREAILQAALSVFSAYGYRGATLDEIAEKAGMSKPNLLYYFPRKKSLYVAVLEETLAQWLAPLAAMKADGDPAEELSRYIDAKIAMSRDNPAASRLFASEILQGGGAIIEFLHGPLKAIVDEKSRIIADWIAAGRLRPVDPRHLIFMIWATTQHYADFDVQVRAVLVSDDETRFDTAAETVRRVVLEGLLPR